MSQSLTISDTLYSKLDAAARQRGLNTVEQFLETLPIANSGQVRFRLLADRWKKETAHVSNVAKKAMHPAYQEIIGMGTSAVGFLLAELKCEPDDWFWALQAITGANPILPDQRGNLQLMAEAWLKWGAEHGYST